MSEWGTRSGLWMIRQLGGHVSPRRLRAWGTRLGAIAGPLATSRRRVAETNLALCFPDWPIKRRQRVARAHFRQLGAMAGELATAWFAKDGDVMPLLGSVSGLHHVDEVQREGRGLLLISGHFTTMEMAARLLSSKLRFGALYRPHDTKGLEEALVKARSHYVDPLLPKSRVRATVRLLRRGGVLWFAPDQHYKGVDAVVAPFFGVPALTITTPAELARMTGAAVMGLHQVRDAAGLYHLTLTPPLEGFPSDHAVSDATRINQLVEANVELAPAQYLWTHRRFKAIPGARQDPYR